MGAGASAAGKSAIPEARTCLVGRIKFGGKEESFRAGKGAFIAVLGVAGVASLKSNRALLTEVGSFERTRALLSGRGVLKSYLNPQSLKTPLKSPIKSSGSVG